MLKLTHIVGSCFASLVKILAFVLALAGPFYVDYHYAFHTGSNTYPYTFWETAAEIINSAHLELNWERVYAVYKDLLTIPAGAFVSAIPDYSDSAQFNPDM